MYEPSPSAFPAQGDLAALASLGDRTRRRLYEFVVRQPHPIGRDEAAAAAGIGRTLAAYHLDRLADEGLLETRFERRSGKTGPGAGRPAKLYFRARRDLGVTVPPRDDELAALILAAAIETYPGPAPAAHVAEVAERAGRALVAEPPPAGRGRFEDRLAELLGPRGYEPYVDRDGVGRLRNCPFDHLTGDHRDLVCGMNLALLRGMTDAAGWRQCRLELDPGADRCCVALREGERDPVDDSPTPGQP